MRRMLILVLVLAMSAAACSGDGGADSSTAAPTTTAAAPETTAHSATTAASSETTAAVGVELDPAGIWQARLAGLRVQITVTPDGPGYQAALDSVDQGAFGIPATLLEVENGEVIIEFGDIDGSFVGVPSADGKSITGLWKQGGAELPVTLTRSDEALAYDRPQEPVPPFPYTSEEVAFDNPDSGLLLAGTLTIPEGEGPFPAMVLISGSGPQDRNEELLGHKPFLVIADHLARNGIAALRYDDRGVGDSTGDFTGAITADFATDATAALDYLLGRAEVDPSAVGLAGHSEGGLIAPMVASGHPGAAFVVLLAGPGQRGADLLVLQSELLLRAEGAPAEYVEWQMDWVAPVIAAAASDLDDAAARARIAEIAADAAATAPEEVPAEEIEAGAFEEYLDPWMRFFLAHDPVPLLQRMRMPVLALNGTLDLQVPVDENLSRIAEALDAAGNPDYVAQELVGLNHLFQHADSGAVSEYARITETFAPEALDLISSWIMERFG